MCRAHECAEYYINFSLAALLGHIEITGPVRPYLFDMLLLGHRPVQIRVGRSGKKRKRKQLTPHFTMIESQAVVIVPDQTAYDTRYACVQCVDTPTFFHNGQNAGSVGSEQQHIE